MKSINLRIAEELNVNERQVAAAVALLDLDRHSLEPLLKLARHHAAGGLGWGEGARVARVNALFVALC